MLIAELAKLHSSVSLKTSLTQFYLTFQGSTSTPTHLAAKYFRSSVSGRQLPIHTPAAISASAAESIASILSDNGPCYIAGELAEYIEARKMSHVRGAPFHPQTQCKIERWHQTLKNRILPGNYYLPGDLETQIEAFVDHYNHYRYHESLNSVTPADAVRRSSPQP